jgi:hypothetical protein
VITVLNSEDLTTEIPQVNLFNTPRFNDSMPQEGWFKDPEELFIPPVEAGLIEDNNVDHPAHYNQGGIEVIDFIEAYTLPYHLGNAVKYIARAGLKNPDTYLEDLKKAKWYLEREINRHG